MTLSTGASSLAFGDSCDPPLGALACSCGVCSSDNTVPCNSDAECSGMGLGSCTNGGGTPRVPNTCNSGTCVDQGGGEGRCDASGPDDKFCDGLSERRRCFLDPIVATGNADPSESLFRDTPCVPHAVAGALNFAFGLPGPERVGLQFQVDPN